MLQYNRNLSRVMEQETISKNWANSKSQMSRGNFLRKVFFALFFASIVFSGCGGSSGKPSVSCEKQTDQIIGVWKLISTDTGPRGGEGIKIITKGHFLWTHAINNTIVSSAGGTYTFDGETYTENIEFGTQGMSNFLGKKGVIKVRFEGNKLYYTGLLAESVPFNEVWERME